MSVVASPTGAVVAQNMIYTHTVSVFNRKHRLVKTISDRITPSTFGYRSKLFSKCLATNRATVAEQFTLVRIPM